MSKENKKLILLDVHAIIHRAYHALPEFASSKGEPTGALYGLSTMLIRIIADFRPDYIVACYDLPKPTHRHEAYKDYKAGRVKTDDELISQIKRSNDIFKALNIPIYAHEGFEADDCLGTIVEDTKKEKNLEVIIASGDMDTLQLVEGKRVKVFTLKKGINDTIVYDEEAVRTRFGFGPELLPDYKGLRGDPSDNIIGIKGIGEKTGGTLIQQFGTVEHMYKVLKKDTAPFTKAGITPRIIELLKNGEEEALFSKMLATIRRDAPINFKLPTQTWREGFNIQPAEVLFNELEFRTLSTRLKASLEGKNLTMAKATPKVKEPVVELTGEELEVLHDAGLLLSIVDSSKADPKLDEVLSFTQAKDVKTARDILYKEAEKKHLLEVYTTIEKPLSPILRAMEEKGIKIDTAYLKKLSKEYHETLAKLEGDIWKLAGEEFNVASPKQLGVILFEKMGLKGKNQKKTDGGALSTKESELEKLRELHPIIDPILKYRELAKLLGTYIDTIPEQVDKESRLHTHFVQMGAVTGRMATTNPSIQNIPNKTDLGRNIRKAFVAEKGYKLVAFDYSQIELRIGAFLSGDKKLIEIFKNGEDVHSAVASEVFGVPIAEVSKEMRRRAKVINFGIMYGMGVNALRTNLGTDRKEAQDFYNRYFQKFSGLAQYLDHVKSDTARTGFTETYFKRRRYFDGIKSKIPFIRAMAERMAINAPIQGTEADIVKLAMVRLDIFLKEKKMQDDVRMLLQVHDELVFEVKESLITKIAPDIIRIMESIIDPKDISGIVIKTDAKVGDNWEEMEKMSL